MPISDRGDLRPAPRLGREEIPGGCGAKSYRYIRTGTNHYSLAFTYDWIASENERRHYEGFISSGEIDDAARPIMYSLLKAMERESGRRWYDPIPDVF